MPGRSCLLGLDPPTSLRVSWGGPGLAARRSPPCPGRSGTSMGGGTGSLLPYPGPTTAGWSGRPIKGPGLTAAAGGPCLPLWTQQFPPSLWVRGTGNRRCPQPQPLPARVRERHSSTAGQHLLVAQPYLPPPDRSSLSSTQGPLSPRSMVKR